MHLFVYGTLMVPEIWRLVAGRDDGGVAGYVRGFRIRRVRDDVYPVMLRSLNADECASGVVYFNISASTCLRLDQYESPMYDRIGVDVALVDGGAAECQAYVITESRAKVASADAWDIDSFRRDKLDEYLKQFR